MVNLHAVKSSTIVTTTGKIVMLHKKMVHRPQVLMVITMATGWILPSPYVRIDQSK